MAKPKSLNKYRHGTKNPQQEVHVYREGGALKVHIIDWGEGRVTTLEKEEPQDATTPAGP